MDYLKELRYRHPDEIIFILIDNFLSHKADVVKDLAKELNIDLCYLPTIFTTISTYRKSMVKN